MQVAFASASSSIAYIRAGKLRAFGVTLAKRLDALPEVPTVGEFVPGYEASTWYGIGAPKHVPVKIIEKVNKEINAATLASKPPSVTDR